LASDLIGRLGTLPAQCALGAPPLSTYAQTTSLPELLKMTTQQVPEVSG
jgi:hypothetical protein